MALSFLWHPSPLLQHKQISPSAQHLPVGGDVWTHRQPGRHGTFEIHRKRQVRMQAALKDKRQRETGKSKDARDPEYENIVLGFRKRDQPKSGQPAPTKQTQAGPPSVSARVPAWLPRSIMSLYILLTLVFLFCLILSALTLVKNSEMSREMRGLKEELSNLSNVALESQEEQRKGWNTIRRDIGEVTRRIENIRKQVETGNQMLKTVPTEITQINKNIQKILEALEKRTNTQPGSK